MDTDAVNTQRRATGHLYGKNIMSLKEGIAIYSLCHPEQTVCNLQKKK